MSRLLKLLLLSLMLAQCVASTAADPSSPTVAASEGTGSDEEEQPAEAEGAEEEEEAEEEAAAAEEEPAPLPASSGTPSPPSTSSASVQFMITAEMKQSLTALGYSAEDIAALQPERAKAIIENGLKRTSKLPGSWTRGAEKPMPVVAAWRSVKRGLSSPVGMGLSVGLSTMAIVAASMSKGSQPMMAPRTKVTKAVPPPRVQAVKPAAPTTVEQIVDIKPPSSDELWLDQQIDKLILFLKAVFRR